MGRSKQVDQLAQTEGRCYVLHLVVMQDFDGQSYQDSFRAARSNAALGGYSAERHRIDCADFK